MPVPTGNVNNMGLICDYILILFLKLIGDQQAELI